MTEPIKSVSLPHTIPGLGSEFTRGVNCDAIELTDRGMLVRRPRTEVNREVYGWDLLLFGGGWCKVEREVAEARCDLCGAVCKNEQGLSAHRRYKHPEGE